MEARECDPREISLESCHVDGADVVVLISVRCDHLYIIQRSDRRERLLDIGRVNDRDIAVKVCVADRDRYRFCRRLSGGEGRSLSGRLSGYDRRLGDPIIKHGDTGAADVTRDRFRCDGEGVARNLVELRALGYHRIGVVD